MIHFSLKLSALIEFDKCGGQERYSGQSDLAFLRKNLIKFFVLLARFTKLALLFQSDRLIISELLDTQLLNQKFAKDQIKTFALKSSRGIADCGSWSAI